MADNDMSDKDVMWLRTLLQMCRDHRMHERCGTIRYLQWAAEIRLMATKLQTVQERLASVSQRELDRLGASASALEDGPSLTLEQLEMINERTAVPYISVLFYGNGREPMEIRDFKAALTMMAEHLKEAHDSTMFYLNKHFQHTHKRLIRPDRRYLEAALWRVRLTTAIYVFCTYFKTASELLSLALHTLNRASLNGLDLIREDKRNESVQLLRTAIGFLHEAAEYTALAGVKAGQEEDKWSRLESALVSILERGPAPVETKEVGM